MLTESIRVPCPYCGESYESSVDCSAGSQEYVEDCAVCCCPILVRIRVDVLGDLEGFDVRCENE